MRPIKMNQETCIPDPADEAYATWLVTCALEQPDCDILVRILGEQCQVSRRHYNQTSTAPLEKLHVFSGTMFPAVRDSLLCNCTVLEHTNQHAAKWKSPILYAGNVFDLLMTSYPAARAPLLQLRPLKHANQTRPNEQFPKLNLMPGTSSVLFYRSRPHLEQFLTLLFDMEAGQHVALLMQDTARVSFENALCLPAHFANLSKAAGACGATLVVFDHPPALIDVLRILRSSNAPPAVIVCAPSNEEFRSGGISPDIDDLVARLSPQMVYLDPETTQIPPTGADSPADL